MMRASGDAAVACAAMTKWSSIPIGPRLLGVTDRPGLVTAEGDEPAAVSGAGERGVDDSAGEPAAESAALSHLHDRRRMRPIGPIAGRGMAVGRRLVRGLGRRRSQSRPSQSPCGGVAASWGEINERKKLLREANEEHEKQRVATTHQAREQ